MQASQSNQLSPNSFLMNDSKFIPFFAQVSLPENVMSFSTWAVKKFKSFSNKQLFQLQIFLFAIEKFPSLPEGKSHEESVKSFAFTSHQLLLGLSFFLISEG